MIASAPGHDTYDPIALLRHFDVTGGAASVLGGSSLPAPYGRLLDHPRDMTSTLEGFFAETPVLRVLDQRRQDTWLERYVELRGADTGRVLEVGAIRIFLDRFPFVTRVAILDGERPLGAILASDSITHRSRPQSFFRLAADEGLSAQLTIGEPGSMLYGRHNALLGDVGPLAEVVEVLPSSLTEG